MDPKYVQIVCFLGIIGLVIYQFAIANQPKLAAGLACASAVIWGITYLVTR